MRERNMLTSQLGHVANRAFNMQQVVAAKEGMESARDTVAIMQAGQSELKALQAAVDIDKAQDVMDDMADTLHDVEDVNEALSYDIGSAVVDDAELEAEMDGLEAELAGGTASYVPAAPPLAVPSYGGGRCRRARGCRRTPLRTRRRQCPSPRMRRRNGDAAAACVHAPSRRRRVQPGLSPSFVLFAPILSLSL
eukprot:TRINITY_DN182_c0_g1_i7.p4 TRINITY_DN182_c0_g1~~TRINITY_DN182_c0_g1_i7.p4  ORF type:complete len:194 (-),score=53.05 TRINITY_DN182_c0_g1_i7:1171-1752(-)